MKAEYQTFEYPGRRERWIRVEVVETGPDSVTVKYEKGGMVHKVRTVPERVRPVGEEKRKRCS